jgi:hypothetical protein
LSGWVRKNESVLEWNKFYNTNQHILGIPMPYSTVE